MAEKSVILSRFLKFFPGRHAPGPPRSPRHSQQSLVHSHAKGCCLTLLQLFCRRSGLKIGVHAQTLNKTVKCFWCFDLMGQSCFMGPFKADDFLVDLSYNFLISILKQTNACAED